MDYSTIYKKSLERAYDNGYRYTGGYYSKEKNKLVDFIIEDYERPDLYTVIFSHDFAKAFWGEQSHSWGYSNPICKFCGLEGTSDVWNDIYCWKSHLQQLVLEEDPLSYLAKFLDNDTRGETEISLDSESKEAEEKSSKA